MTVTITNPERSLVVTFRKGVNDAAFAEQWTFDGRTHDHKFLTPRCALAVMMKRATACGYDVQIGKGERA